MAKPLDCGDLAPLWDRAERWEIMRDFARIMHKAFTVPGSISDSYDPEFGTGQNCRDVKELMEECRDHIVQDLGELKDIVQVAHGEQGPIKTLTLSERERRIIRFAINRALESM